MLSELEDPHEEIRVKGLDLKILYNLLPLSSLTQIVGRGLLCVCLEA